MKYIYLAEEYHLVVGDKFELFYRGVIKLNNPYQYYIRVRCDKGTPYLRYYTFTPKDIDEGVYDLSIELLDNDNKQIDIAYTKLKVVKPVKPNKKLNILCIGDSLTVNGVWPKEAYRRICTKDGAPTGLGFEDSLNFIGTCKVEESNEIIGYEGYGGWTWRSYTTNEHISFNSSVWVKTKHDKTEQDQHTLWESNNKIWILETIEKDRLKFKRGPNNISMVSNLGDKFTHLENAVNQSDIIIESFEFEKGNPFYSKKNDNLDIIEYLEENNFPKPDLIYILLTWNGLYKPFNEDFSHHFDYAKILIDHIHSKLKDTKITLLGIQVCSVNGGIASNYGASGPYSDTFGTISSCFNYNYQLEKFTKQNNYKDFLSYVDTKAMFDSEYNMPSTLMQVNARNKTLETVGTNGVHPTMEGYLQIGDIFYRKLIHDINKL